MAHYYRTEIKTTTRYHLHICSSLFFQMSHTSWHIAMNGKLKMGQRGPRRDGEAADGLKLLPSHSL